MRMTSTTTSYRFIILFVAILLAVPVRMVASQPEVYPENRINNSTLCHSAGGYEDTMYQGLEAFYRTDWNTAESCFERMKLLDPEDPRALFFTAMIPFWEYYFVENNRDLADRFMKLSDKAIQQAERKLESKPDDLHLISMLSGLYGYQSLVASEESRIRTALLTGRIGFGYTQQLLKRQEESPEVDIGRGIYHYMVGSIPGSLRWLAALFGLKGDREYGFHYLNRAACSSSYVRLDAKMVLSTIHKRERQYDQALSYTRRLLVNYEENIIFLFVHAELLEQSGKDFEALSVFQKIADMNHDRLFILIERSRERASELQAEIRSL